MADEVICLETPSGFSGVGQFYERFDQVSDEEAMAYLESSSWLRGSPPTAASSRTACRP